MKMKSHDDELAIDLLSGHVGRSRHQFQAANYDQGKAPVRPAPRHAQLAVNLAGSTALFIVETWEARESATGGRS